LWLLTGRDKGGNLADCRIYIPEKGNIYPALSSLIGGTLNVALMAAQWKEVPSAGNLD